MAKTSGSRSRLSGYESQLHLAQQPWVITLTSQTYSFSIHGRDNKKTYFWVVIGVKKKTPKQETFGCGISVHSLLVITTVGSLRHFLLILTIMALPDPEAQADIDSLGVPCVALHH